MTSRHALRRALRVGGLAVALTAGGSLLAVPADAARKPSPPVTFTAKLGSEARRGGHGSLALRIAIDPKRVAATMTQLRVYTPRALDLGLSGLGLDECAVADERFAEVMVSTPTPVTCPANALLATGTARAELRFSTDEIIHAQGAVSLYSGASASSDPGLVTIVESRHPVATQLVYSGTIFDAPRPYGIGIRIQTPPLPAMPLDATTAITRMALTIGSPSIVYTRRDSGYTVRYQPASIPIPRSCPKRGYRFWAELRFGDQSRRTATAYAACPRRSARR